MRREWDGEGTDGMDGCFFMGVYIYTYAYIRVYMCVYVCICLMYVWHRTPISLCSIIQRAIVMARRPSGTRTHDRRIHASGPSVLPFFG